MWFSWGMVGADGIVLTTWIPWESHHTAIQCCKITLVSGPQEIFPPWRPYDHLQVPRKKGRKGKSAGKATFPHIIIIVIMMIIMIIIIINIYLYYIILYYFIILYYIMLYYILLYYMLLYYIMLYYILLYTILYIIYHIICSLIFLGLNLLSWLKDPAPLEPSVVPRCGTAHGAVEQGAGWMMGGPKCRRMAHGTIK